MAKREELMARWEQECRQWLEYENRKNNNEYLDVNATFFKDGVIDPETWFDEKNTFRPLFILKEVNDQKPTGEKTFDFVAMDESDGHDIWNGVSKWRRLAVLANGLKISLEDRLQLISYDETYRAFYHNKTSNYKDALRHIAIMNVKKLGGGAKVKSEESKKTIIFTEHAKQEQLKKNLKEQIVEQIQPDIIIFFGIDTHCFFDIKNDKLFGIPVITSRPHPSSRKSNKEFYNETIKKVKEIITNK
ncbi:MAG: hypothetical protein IKU84_01165 [Clostridia bacterium]|nr:hypothetical protein [Clostridia bacterium]